MARVDGALVKEVLADLVTSLAELEPAVRRDAPDSVHQARVITRRLRSALQAFRPWLERADVEPLRDELRWWGHVLGAARDREVQRDRAGVLLDALPVELVVGPVRARVQAELDAAYRAAHADVVVRLDQPRHAALVASLDAFVSDLPGGGAHEADVAGRAAHHAWRRVRRRQRRARDVLVGITHDGDASWSRVPTVALHDDGLAGALHELRKAARAARYVGEAVEPVAGKRARRFAAAFEDVQDALGEHHDAIALQSLFREMGMRAHLAGENGFTYGLLVAAERERARLALDDFAAAWRRAKRHRLRSWTTR